MALFHKFMFLPRRIMGAEIRVEELSPEELKIEKGTLTIKEILIVSFLYLLMASSVITLILYLIMNYQHHSNAKDVLDIFKYVFSTLVGYFLGTNKEK
ncbi:MAG TPA: hypothetical protein VJL89_12225 [Thermodesulfovibrionia bacterium]|nr:hypothetical protein [Thermodesulfovibrionia bacterium]